MPFNSNQPGSNLTGRETPLLITRRLIIATVSMVILFSSSTVPAGKIYKWTDAEGKVHYGSEKPAGAEAEKMKVDTGKTGVDRGAKALDDLKQGVDDEAQRIKEEGIPP